MLKDWYRSELLVEWHLLKGIDKAWHQCNSTLIEWRRMEGHIAYPLINLRERDFLMAKFHGIRSLLAQQNGELLFLNLQLKEARPRTNMAGFIYNQYLRAILQGKVDTYKIVHDRLAVLDPANIVYLPLKVRSGSGSQSRAYKWALIRQAALSRAHGKEPAYFFFIWTDRP